VWLSPVEHCVRDAGVAGSNPATPTITQYLIDFIDLERNEMRTELAACFR
jgi:hypothetical protein